MDLISKHTFNSNVESAFGTAKKAAAKAMAKAGNLMMAELSDVECLMKYTKLSIKVDAIEEVTDAALGYAVSGKTQFHPVTFCIRDETRAKRTVLTVRLEPSVGFVISKDGDDLMRVVLPEQSDNTYCKIQHSSGATIYKVSTADSLGHIRAVNTTVGSSASPTVLFEQDKLWYMVLPKMIGVAFDQMRYRAKGHTEVYGSVWPKLRTVTRDAIMIKFNENANDQVRAIMLGFALVTLLKNAHLELYNLLKISMKDADD